MITPAYSPTATERVLPRLALDFTTGVLDPRVTVTRALNTATRINSSGLIEIVNANLPRFDYDPVTLAARGLLIEETRQNILLYSEQFNDPTWVKTNLNPATDQIVAPDGTQTADKLDDGSALGVHSAFQSFSSTSGVSYSYSMFLKNGDRRYAQLFFGSAGHGSNAFANFDLQAGTIGTVGSSATASITNMGNGWYRCAITAAATATTASASAQLALITSSTSARAENYTGSDKFLYPWGAQLEAGAFATSYIPTTTTSLTRNADVVSMTGTNFSDWYNQAEGTIVVELAGRGSLFGGVTFDNGAPGNNIDLLCASGLATGVIANGSVTQLFMQPVALVAGSTNRFGLAYKLNNSVFYGNTVTTGTDTSCTIPTVNRAVIGWYPSAAASYLNGHMKKIFYYNLRVLNAETQAFTK